MPRSWFESAIAIVIVVAVSCQPTAERTATPSSDLDSGLAVVLEQSRQEDWSSLPIGERIGRFGLALVGTPYADGTLEGPGPEVCRVTTTGFDCVTFMELVLNLGRVSARPGGRSQDVLDAVQFTRYRGGVLTDYTSRLHYTSEWISDNVSKGVLEDVTEALGGEPAGGTIDFMSEHPASYAALEAHPAFVDSMRAIEAAINRRPRWFVPKGRVAEIEPQLRTGDLVAVATSIAGLDYSHTGLIVRDDDLARFLHASSKHEQVTLDTTLSVYLAAGPKHVIGVTITRPLETR